MHIGVEIKELLEYIVVGILLCFIATIVGAIAFFLTMFGLWLLKMLAWPIVLGIMILFLGTVIGIVGYIRERVRRNS